VVRTTVANKALILDMADTILLELVLMRKWYVCELARYGLNTRRPVGGAVLGAKGWG
jgi:hypothetical protein